LSEQAIHAGLKPNRPRINPRIHPPNPQIIKSYGSPDGAEGVKPLCPGPLPIGLLQISRRDVIQREDVRNKVPREVFRNVSPPPTYDKRHLAFEIDTPNSPRDLDGLAREKKRRRGLKKEQGSRGDLVPQLTRMVAVVSPDAENLGGGEPEISARRVLLGPAQGFFGPVCW
jgi:hypothetical protein